MLLEKLLRNWSEYAVIPCKQNTKIPATKNGFKGAKKGQNVLQIAEQGYNVGLALSMSNLIAIDCDVDETKDYNGLQTLAEKEKELGKLPKTLTQRTPRGGRHYIFSANDITNPIGKIGKDIDVKYAGYVMIAPSSINGRFYQIIDGIDENGNFIFAELPENWLNYINKVNYSKGNAQKTKNVSTKCMIYKNINIEKMLKNCAFLKHCEENADCLSEPEWFSMISVLAPIENSEELIHSLSEPYPKYSYSETQKKIENARNFGHPQTCAYISTEFAEICKNCPSAVKKGLV